MPLSLLLLLAAGAVEAAKPVRCPKRISWAEMTQKVLAEGERAVHGEIFEEIIQTPVTVMSLLVPKDKSGDGKDHFYDVVYGEAGGKMIPRGILMSSIRDTRNRRERWIMLVDLQGRLQTGLNAWDDLNEEGEMQGQTSAKVKGKFNPDTISQYKAEVEFHCLKKVKLPDE